MKQHYNASLKKPDWRFSIMKHTKECQEYQEGIIQAQEEYDKKYPNYCIECEGTGGQVYYENHGLPGVSESFFEPCEACLTQDICPRCGHKHESRYLNATGDWEPWFNDVFVKCLSCGWAEEDNDGGRPYFDCCGCAFLSDGDDIPY